MTTRFSSPTFAWFLFWAYSFFILQAAVVPPRFIPHFVTLINDKGLHSFEFLLMYAVAYNAFRRAEQPILTRHVLTAAFIYILGLGGVTEFLQSLTPYREPQLSDWIADAAGGLVGWAIMRWKSSAGKIFPKILCVLWI